MHRNIEFQLLEWKNRLNHKPLILKGARQVGKTYIIKFFGQKNYENVAYFNFDLNKHLGVLFKENIEPARIIEQLSFSVPFAINPHNTLIFFDEIQECPEALNSLKYFQEFAPEFDIICAGSLLGLKLSHTSFPVGKVEFLEMYPMTFSEFLLADKCQNELAYIESINSIQEIPQHIFSVLNEKIKQYFIIGGMPEAVDSWTQFKDISQVLRIQNNILLGYENDFNKHLSSNNLQNKINIVWESLISQLSKENKKFIYKLVKEGARAREYEDAVNWLNEANLIAKVFNVSKANLPLSAYIDPSCFKLYLLDVGLLCRKADLDTSVIIEGDRLFTEFKGALTENYICNTLNASLNKSPNYHTFDRYEIDFLIQYNNKVLPIEVKSSNNMNYTSLTRFCDKYANKYAIVYSTKNLNQNGDIINIPLFLAEYTSKLLECVNQNNFS